MSISSILALLQLVSAMLNNPSLANNPSTRNLANQAVVLATQALAQISVDANAIPSSTAPTPQTTPMPGISVTPSEILQGDPILITATASSSLKQVILDGKSYPVFTYAGKSESLIGIDLAKKPGAYELRAVFKTGEIATTTIAIIKRPKPPVESVPIPEKLGGNTSSSQKALVASISSESAALKKVISGKTSLWTKSFIPPLAAISVTNPYGYGVDTGAYVIAHKGTDLKAGVGTKVFAMNRGIVKLTRNYTVYGKTILIDHGLGLQTLYLHLSKINVKEGSIVTRGQVIGLSGDTGYITGPHLHLSIRLNGTSIDPIKFMSFFEGK